MCKNCVVKIAISLISLSKINKINIVYFSHLSLAAHPIKAACDILYCRK